MGTGGFIDSSIWGLPMWCRKAHTTTNTRQIMENLQPETGAAYGEVRDGKVYRKAFRDYPEREIGIVKDDAATALAYFARRFEVLKAKVEQLLADMEAAENKGSYLNKIVHERQTLPEANALGDIGPLLDLLEEKEAALRENVTGNRAKNLEAKRNMLTEMETLKAEEDERAQAIRIRELRMSWIKTGPVAPEHQPEIETRYQELMQYYYEKRKAYIEVRNAMIEKRIAIIDNLLERQRELFAPETHPGHIIKTLQQLANEWKETGQIPKVEYDERKERFREVKRELMNVAKRAFRAHKKAEESREPRPLTPEEIEQLKNFNAKKALVEQAKEILEKGDFRGAYPKVKEMQAAWHNIGPTPKAKAYINKDFTYFCDRISEFSYLNKMLYQSDPYYFRKTPRELCNAKINIMRDIIRKEESDIQQLQAQLDAILPNNAPAETVEARAMVGRYNSQNRRLNVKKEILAEFKVQLNEMMSAGTY